MAAKTDFLEEIAMSLGTTIQNPPNQEPFMPPMADVRRRVNPWVSDHVLLSLSLWWVRMTHPESDDPGTDVALMFNSLQDELQ